MWEDARGSIDAMPPERTAGRHPRAGLFRLPPSGYGAVLLALALCGGTGIAQAQGDWQPELAPADADFRGRSDALVILLPADLDPATYERLAVELDNLDVTAFASAEAGQLTLQPPEALSSGNHSLRLIERGEDGSILERGAWTFEVRQSALVRDLSLNADLAGRVNTRVAANGLDTPSQYVTGDSGGNVDAAAGDEQWRISARGNYIYNSQAALGLNGEHFDLEEYRLDGDFHSDDFFTGVTLGDHDTGIDNLIMSGFHRRGISVRAGTTDQRLTMTGFVQRPESVVGTQHTLGINNAEKRIEGASVSVRPIEALQDNIVLTGTFYTGEGSDGGFGIGTEEVVNEGTGWSVVADTLWFDQSLRLRGEYAQSTFDFDGKDTGFNAEHAEAYSVLASLEPFRGATLDGSNVNWTVGARRDEVDTFFQSLANPSLQPDRETTSVFTDFFWDEFTAQFQIDHELSNVDNLDYLPTDRTINVFFNGTYTPFIEPLEDGSLPWYGQPFFGIQASLYDVDRIERSKDNPTEDADQVTRSVTLSTGANYETWSWNLSHTVSSFTDHVGLASDTMDNRTTLGAYVLVSDWLTLSPSLDWVTFEDLDTGDDNQTLNFILGAEVTVIPETLTASLTYNMNRRMGDGDTPDTNSFNGEVVWTLRKPEANKLGVSLALTGFVQDTNDDYTNPEENLQYQAFTALRLSLPVAY